MNEREFWAAIRRAFIMIVVAISKRWGFEKKYDEAWLEALQAANKKDEK